jgi:flavin reductase (DIM6/NTAB) family NADH-FMN oxidoreductase RutF
MTFHVSAHCSATAGETPARQAEAAVESSPTVTPEQYRGAFRRHPGGVVVITMSSPSGPVGFTATSFVSLSLDPPLASFNITHVSSSIAALSAASSAIVHVVSDDQAHLAARFARDAAQRFADLSSWSLLPTGEPVLHGTRTWFRIGDLVHIPAGDSVLVIARIVAIHCEADARPSRPLVYHEGRFQAVAPLDEA